MIIMMDHCFVLAKDSFAEFFKSLSKLGRVYAPVKVSDQSYSFRQVESHEQIAFEALRTILPPKKYFYPTQETILRYNDGQIEEHKPEIDFQILFGVHPCDLAGLGIMDTIFTAGPADSHYLTRRQSSLIVGLSCMPDKHCFCQSMGTDCPESGYDLFLTDIGDDYLLEVRTAAGVKAVDPIMPLLRAAGQDDESRYKAFWSNRAQAFTNGFKPDNLRSVMAIEWDNKIWDEMADRCLSCGNCTPVCPTCYCFDLVDIASLNGTSGERRREWDSCQFVGFAQVAGDYNFRPGPVDRLKFWYRHKLHGFDDPFGFQTCVGCGRCTVSCPAGIDDIVSVVQALQATNQAKTKHDAN